jgi:CRP/FNR family transcriptional regulator, cyclic AMP receptor protein
MTGQQPAKQVLCPEATSTSFTPRPLLKDRVALLTLVRHTVPVSALTRTGDLVAGALRREGRPVRFHRGHALFTQGDRAERVFVIERGSVMVTSMAPGGREIVLGLRGPGDLIGELSALDAAPRSAAALAVEEVEATVAPSSALIRALSDAAIAMDLLRVLASRLRDADRKRLEFAALDTLGRVAWRLEELSERFGEQTPDGIDVELPLSQEQLASWCGASREATVKALATLRTLGCISTGRRSVLIRDIEALHRHAYGAL